MKTVRLVITPYNLLTNWGCAKLEFSKQSLLPCSILADFLPRPKKKFAELIMTESRNIRPNLYEKA
jgi:hypothetical protein